MNKRNSKAKNLALAAYGSALLLYLHLLVFIAVFGVILIRHREIGNDFSAFHLRQMFGIGAIAIAISVFQGVIPNVWIALAILSLMVLLALLGLLSAARDQKTELPFIGQYFQEWFSFIK
jgi:hypothetical protein